MRTTSKVHPPLALACLSLLLSPVLLLLFVLLVLSVIAAPAWAGPNAGGTLILHINQTLVYCDDTDTYCGQSALSLCNDAVTRHDGSAPVIFFAIASFPTGSSPRLRAIAFGINYDATNFVLAAQGPCGDFELAESNWPAPGTGTALTWNTTQTGLLADVYWFLGYNYYSPQPTSFAVMDHPAQNGVFGDDSVPALLDDIAAFGALGFDQPGVLPCGPPPSIGACCFSDCVCIVLPADDCTAMGGSFAGADMSCDPNPCSCPPVGACCLPDCTCAMLLEQDCLGLGGTFQGAGQPCDFCTFGQGACCLPDERCVIATTCECADAGGTYQGDGVECEPTMCHPISTERTTWGKVKATYR